MTYLFFDKLDDKYWKNQIKNFIDIYDSDFIPPLSSRQTSLDNSFHNTDIDKNDKNNYFESIIKQSFILCVEDEKLIGFMSFKMDYLPECIGDKKEKPLYVYVTTIIIDKNSRGKGIARNLYIELCTHFYNKKIIISTRTWSHNYGHLSVLNKMGFKRVLTINNDRGEGVNTVYFIKNLN